MYANSRFKKSVNEWGRVEGWIEPGDEISQSDLDVSDEEWQSLIDAGVVVESYPEGLDPQTPPAEYYRANPEEAPGNEEVTVTDDDTNGGDDDGNGGDGSNKPAWQNP